VTAPPDYVPGHGLLAGRTVVVTAAAGTGIGSAVARKAVEEGATVLISDFHERRLGETADRLATETGTRPDTQVCDVTVEADVQGLVDAAAERLGGIDVMVNNAGILTKQSVLEASEADYERLMAVNVKGVYFGAQAAARRMVRGGRGGVIVNVSSIAGIRGTGGYGLYNASKGAVRLLTMALADELGPVGVRVVALHPGMIETQMNVTDDPLIGSEAGERYRDLIPLRRWGRPDEVGQAVVFLASDRAAYVTGASLVIDGGYLRT
jgi:NAD(P)-dependent dehydrogenase (short-subunit alcohol dehydrogenase family)